MRRSPGVRSVAAHAIRSACLALALATVGCSDPILDRWPRVDIAGVARTASGSPVEGASVSAVLHLSDCSATTWSSQRTTTGSDGRFALSFTEPSGLFEGCVQLEAVKGGSTVTAEWPAARITPDDPLEVELTFSDAP